ncbi:Cytochrome P450 family protein [Ceratobasidium theobromae]|uniref:Cytochrome P450 family protein n=1 Tax=Ceratobasidium theobromae TaxID=1582974 RepID=A0A5N5QMC8_9AGAM|nr:Cytochrome P450 family protein [Ceratobasidium theobromae]
MDFFTGISRHFVPLPVTAWLACGFIALVLVIYILNNRRRLLIRLPGPPSGRWTTGHFPEITGVYGVEFQRQLVSDYGPTMMLNGAFGEELIFTVDPVAIQTIFVKDKSKFERAEGAARLIRSVFGGGLLGMTGEEHRMHRKLLNPVFTSKFLRELVITSMPLFMDIAKQTCQGIKQELASAKNTANEIDIFHWTASAALELIGEAGLGYSFNSFGGERNEYYYAVKSVMQVLTKVTPFMPILPYLYRFGTPSFRRWVLKYIPWGPVQRLRYAVSMQNAQAEEVLRARQALISSGVDLSSLVGRGRDIMTLLMKANMEEGSGFRIDRQAMVGHMNTAIAHILDMVANHQDVQERLRLELTQYFKSNPDDSYHEGLIELPYLDAVVRETLRLHGPVSFLTRVCKQDTTIPLSDPIETPSGKITSIPVKKGTRIMMSVIMSNRYEKIWGERGHEFLPQRWIGNKLDGVTQTGVQLPGVYSSM